MVLGEGGHAVIIGVQHRYALRTQLFNEFALGGRDAVDGIEAFDMRPANVGDDSDVGTRDRGQGANLSGVIHPHLQHCDARVFIQT